MPGPTRVPAIWADATGGTYKGQMNRSWCKLLLTSMLLFVSDLHLCDGSVPPAIRIPDFVRTLSGVAQTAEAERVEALDVVLLGDIFEMLKTPTWLTIPD